MTLDQNPDSLEVNCSYVQAPSFSTKSDPPRPPHPRFKYYVFSLLSSKLKFLGGSPCKSLTAPLKKNCESDFDTTCSLSSEEADHLTNSTEEEV